MDLARLVIEIVRSRKPTFDELRDEIEKRGIVVDSRVLRRTVANLVRSGLLCKEWDPSSRRFRLLLCIEP